MTTEREQILALAGEPAAYLVHQINGMCDGHCVEGVYLKEADAESACGYLGEYFAGTDKLFTADQLLAARKPLEDKLAQVKADAKEDEVNWDQEVEELRQQLAAANARISELEAQAVPEGWKLVPIEPTEEMVIAGNIGQGFSKWALKAAIEAAPQAAQKWQPIETLPEGERFLSVTRLSNGSFGQVGISHSFYSHIVNNRGWKIAGDDPHATHWMPLPAAPSPKGEKNADKAD